MDKEEEFKTIEILNGLVYCNTAKKYIPKNITISSGKIQRIDLNTKSDPVSPSSLKIDAKNCIVTSSFTDCAVRIKEPGSEYKGTMYSELKSAVGGESLDWYARQILIQC